MKRGNETAGRGEGRVQRGSVTLFQLIGTDEPGPTTRLGLEELEQRLEASVLELPDAYRRAIELHCLAGMSAAEIARSGELTSPTGKAVSTPDGVRVIVHRARKLLESVLAGL